MSEEKKYPELADHPAIVKAREEHFKGTAIKDPFTISIVGDMIITYPFSQRIDPELRGVLDPIKESDVAFGNMESNFGDLRNARKGIGGLMGTKDVAADVKKMGFEIVARSSNHSTDQGIDEMVKSNQYLQDAGIVYAGTGINLEDARAPQYLETPKGRIGLVAMTTFMRGNVDKQSSRSADCGMEMATYQSGNRYGTAGNNAMRVTPAVVLPPELFEGIRKIKEYEQEYGRKMTEKYGEYVTTDGGKETDKVMEHLYGKVKDPSKQALVYTQMFKEGDAPCGLSYEMNADDLRLNLRSIRQGKEWSDYMIASIHTHDQANTLRKLDFLQHEPSDYLIDLAHQSIDNGADVFTVTGPHLVRGIEIYKGRPIFYSLHAFAFQVWGTPTGSDRYSDNHVSEFYTETTETEINMSMWPGSSITHHDDLSNMETMESVYAQLKYDEGKLQEIILRPIEFGYGVPISQHGMPRVPKPNVADRILKRMQRLCEPFGTEVVIEGELGYIRL